MSDFDPVHETPAQLGGCRHPALAQERKSCGCASVITCRCGYVARFPEDHHKSTCKYWKGFGNDGRS